MTIDLDALEKRLTRRLFSRPGESLVNPDGPEAVSTIKALIAELKEAKEHLARCVELVPAPGAIEAADACVASNGKGEG